jgi:CheY-like chemotaxis protein
MGNEAEIRQAVTNLILNAVDAMPTGGTLKLRTYEKVGPPDTVILEVSDSGIGMDEETRERAFEPFFSTKGARGSGMGLATVYGTMQRHEGAVGIDSALGKGTTMRLIFPVPEEITERVNEASAFPPLPMRILCVDDEPLLREALKEILENEGHNVELADGGRSGLDAFRAAYRRGEPFEVVITDLGMPHVDGRQVARSIKAEAPETPVILLTGWGQRLRAEDEIPEDVDVLLCKPPRIDLLNLALSRVALGD